MPYAHADQYKQQSYPQLSRSSELTQVQKSKAFEVPMT